MRQSGEDDPFVRAAGELGAQRKENARKDRLDAVRNATIRNKVLANVETNGGVKTASDTLRSLLHGTNIGSRESIEGQWRGLTAGWQSVLSSKLKRAGVEKAAISGEIDKDIAKDIWALRNGKPVSSGPSGQIAKAMLPALNATRDRLNAAGARIGEALDYVTHTLHDPAKMRAAAGAAKTPDEAFKAWWDFAKPRLAERTFENVADRDKFGESVFKALLTGIHMTPDGATGLATDEHGYVPPAFEGTYNIARKVSQPRVLLWKDGESWQEYMKQFGSAPSLSAGVMHTLDQSARQVALMEKLGTNPAANLNQIIRRIQETYRDADPDGVKKFGNKVQGLNNVMGRLDGSLNIPANEMWAKVGGNVRTLETTGTLGGVGVTHFASIWVTVPSEMYHHGFSRFETLGNMIKALVPGTMKGTEKEDVLADLGAFSHSLVRDMQNRWGADESVSGHVSAIANIFMKYTALPYIFDRTQAGVREMLASRLGRSVGKTFDELDPRQSKMLGKYGIGEDEWNLLRAVPNLPVVEGRAYLTPKDATRIESTAAEALLRKRGTLGPQEELPSLETTAKAVDGLRNELSDKLLSYYGDAAAHAVVTPGVRERAMLLGATRPGTIEGELARYVTQFKMWPVAGMSQVIGREIYLGGSKGRAAWQLGTLVGLGALAGYMRMTVNDVALGHPIRNPLDPRTLLAAVAQSGGFGILGDFLFGETSRMGGGLVSTLAGPVVGDADAMVKIMNEWKQGKAGWPDLAHFMVRHVPFANLVYLKGTLDYMMWYHLYEAASPGWWERTNRRLEKEQGRTMTGFTPGGGVPYGVPGIYLKSRGGQASGLFGSH